MPMKMVSLGTNMPVKAAVVSENIGSGFSAPAFGFPSDRQVIYSLANYVRV